MSVSKILGGYIILSRKIIDSEIWSKPPLYLKVWIYLLCKAQHKRYKTIDKGCLYINIPDIIKDCQWKIGYRTVKPTKDQIYQVLEWMRNASDISSTKATMKATTKAPMIATTKATHGMLIKIENYGFYQNPKNYESNDESNNESNDEPATNPNNINKNDKNDKNDKKKIIGDFTQNKKLITAINDFMEMRTKIKKSMTDRAVELLLNKLSTMADTDEEKIALLEQSTANSWLSVYPLKQDKQPKGGRANDKRRISRADNFDWETTLGVD